MSDLDERLRRLDRLDAPDLWNEIRTREPTRGSEPWPRHRLAVAILALAVAAAGIAGATWAFTRSTGPKPSSTPNPAASPGVRAFQGTLAFQRSVDGGSFHLIVLDHGVESDLGSGSEPAWSPDGSRIAFLWGYGQGQVSLYIVKPDGSGRRRLATVGGFPGMGPPAWSSDGSTIAIGTGDQGIVIVSMSDGATAVAVHRSGCREFDPTRSPKDHRLAYVAQCDLGVPGSGVRVVGEHDRVIVPDQPGTSYHSLAWSPLGDVIAFQRSVVTAQGPAENHLFLVAPDGSGLRDITRDPTLQDGDPSWSPGGSRLAFESAGKLYYQLWVMDADGSHRVRVTFGEGQRIEDSAPAWRPGS